MKAIILIILIGIFFACNKNNAKPATTNTTTVATTSTVSMYESTLLGKWNLSNFAYSQGTVTVNSFHTDTVNCFMNLKSTPFTGADNYKQLFGGLGCYPQNSFWKADNVGYLTVGSISYQIVTLTTNSLVIQTGDINTGLQKYYFWK